MATTYPKTEKKQSVADLAWEYSENKRKGQAVRMRDYLVKCPDRQSRLALKELVNTDLLLDLVAQGHARA